MDYPYESTHIKNLTPEMVAAIIQNPEATYEDLDALSFAVTNSTHPELGIASDWIDEISLAIDRLQYG